MNKEYLHRNTFFTKKKPASLMEAVKIIEEEKNEQELVGTACQLLSCLLEDALYTEETKNKFVTHCEYMFPYDDPLIIAAKALHIFDNRIYEESAINNKPFIVEKSLKTCDFACKMYENICGKQKA